MHQEDDKNEITQVQVISEPTKETTSTSTSTPPASTAIAAYSTYSTENFLSRCNLSNDKINSILRSPPPTQSAVRQRSVFTANSSSTSKFNASAAPFVSQRSSAAAAVAAAAAATACLATKEPSTPPNPISARSVVPSANGQITFGAPALHMSSPHHRPIYECSALSGRSNMLRSLSARSPLAPPPSPIYAYDNDLCRMSTTLPPGHQSHHLPQPMPPPPYVSRMSNSNREFDTPPPPCHGAGPIAMSNGTIQLRLRDGVRIDMTLDRAVRVVNQRSVVAIALSRNCSSSALIHPNGRMLQTGSKVEIVTYDGMKSNNYVRYAKMWYKGVCFTSETCALTYLVDTAGTRTTTDSFTDLTKDYTLTVFYEDSRHGPAYVQEAAEIIQNSTYTCADDGTEVYDINGFRISQAADGLVKLTRTHNKILIRTSPGNGSATLSTPGIHCTASLGKTSHLFVRRSEKRMHFDGSCFIVRNAGHSAGFNENNLLIVY